MHPGQTRSADFGLPRPDTRAVQPTRWALGGFAAVVLLGACLRWNAAHAPFDVPELDFVKPPWTAEKTFGSDLVRAGLREVSEILWSISLHEATARLTTILPALAAVALASLALGCTAGWSCAVLMGATLAFLPHPALSGTTINPGPWTLAGALAALTLANGTGTLLALRAFLSGVLLAALATASPIALAVWLAIAAVFWERGGVRSRSWGPAVVWLGVAGALVGVANEPPRSFFRPWSWATVWSFGGQVPGLVGGWLWVLAVAGVLAGAVRPGHRWLVAWVCAGGSFAAVGQYWRWVLDEGTFALTVFPVLALASVGAGALGERVWALFRPGGRPLPHALVGGMLLLGPLLLARSIDPLPRGPDWRAVAEVVRVNVGPRDALVTSRCRRAVVFYAPELFRRFPEEADPGRALAVFPGTQSGWLVVPAIARLYPSWWRVEEWLAQFGVIDLSPDPNVHVFYYRREGRRFALLRATEFSLPSGTLRRGDLLLQMLEVAGPVPALLWKIDQLVLEPGALSERNERLVELARKLAGLGARDRATALAQRLAALDPTWDSAQALLSELETQDPRRATRR